MLKNKSQIHYSGNDARNIIYPKYFDKDSPFYILVAGHAQYEGNYVIVRRNATHTRLIYVISGSGFVETEEKKYPVKTGDTILLLSGTNHNYYHNPDDPWKIIWINIYGDLAVRLTKSYNLQNKKVFNCDTKSELEKIYNILNEDTYSIDEKKNEPPLIFHKIIQKLYASLPKDTHLSNDASIMKIYIDSHIESIITIDELGSLINRCSSQASRIFKKEMGVTPYEYHLQNKMQRAIMLLETTDIQIKEIAYNLGFSDEHYFSDIFKRKTGKKPTEYRKNNL